jgi:hypothetical protein
MDCATLSISDPTQTAIDSLKICKLNHGKDVLFFMSEEGIDTPFAPSSFGEESRNKQNLDLRCDGDYLKFFTKLDTWAVDYITLNSIRLLGASLPIESVLEIYKPCVRKRTSFNPLLRTKITLDGLTPTRYWDTEKKSRLAPNCWQTTVFKTRLRVGYLYITSNSIGFALDCTDIQVCQELSIPECPF